MLNQQKKIFITNFFSLTFVELLNKLIPFLILPYMIKIIGIEKFGLLMFALAIVQYFKSITDYGFDLYSTREISKVSNNINLVSKIFFTTISIKIVISLILFIFFIVIIESFELFYKDRFIYYSTYFMIFGYVLLPLWVFQGMQQLKSLTYITFITRSIFVLLLIIFIKNENDYYLIPIFESSVILIAGLASFVTAIKKFKLQLYIPNKKDIKIQVKESFNIFILDFIPNLYNAFTIFLLGVLTNNTLVGYYSVVYKISSATTMIITILRNITFPYLNKNFMYFKKVKVLLISTGIILTLILILFNEYLIKIFVGNTNSEIEILLYIISISPFLISLTASYGTNFLLVKKLDKSYKKIVIVGSIIGFISSFILIEYYNVVGAVLTLVIARLIIAFGTTYKYFMVRNNYV